MGVTSSSSFHGIIGRSPVMRALFSEIERVAAADIPVLIRGESGTGKELVVRAIQRLSARRDQPFEILNCADLTRELLRSELFGHERGAFTGAVNRSTGLVHRLDGGTLFMDEIGELAPDAQAMLLRFLQAGEGRAVGRVEVLPRTSVSLRPRIGISKPEWSRAPSGKTCTTGCGARSSRSRHFVLAERTSRLWWTTFERKRTYAPAPVWISVDSAMRP